MKATREVAFNAIGRNVECAAVIRVGIGGRLRQATISRYVRRTKQSRAVH